MEALRARVACFNRSHRGVVVLLVVLVATVGTAVTVVAAGATRTLSAADRYEAAYGGGFGALIEQVEGESRAEEIRSLPSVTEVNTLTFVFGAALDGDGRPHDAIVFAGSPDAVGAQILEGRRPRASDEFVVSAGFVAGSGASVGDRIELVTLSKEQAATTGFDTPPGDFAGPRVTATLVGVFSGPTDLQEAASFVFVPPEMVDLADVGIASSQHTVGLRPGAGISRLRAELDGLPNPDQFAVDAAQLVVPDVRRSVDTRGHATAVLALVLGIAAVAVSGQILTRQVRLGDDEMRALRGLGMTSRQLVADAAGRAVIPLAAGALIAAPVAYVLSGRFPLGFVAAVDPVHGRRFETAHLWVPAVIAVALGVWVVAAMAAARRERTVDSVPAVERVARAAPGARSATSLRFAFSRARVGGSVVVPLVGLGLVASTVAGATTFGSGMGRLIDEPGSYGDFDIRLGQGGGVVAPEVVEVLESTPGIGTVALATNVVTTLDSRALDLTGLDTIRGSYEPVVFAGRAPVTDTEVMLGKVTAEDVGADVGDSIEVASPAGRSTFRVVGIGVVPSVGSGDGVGQGGLVVADALRRLDPDVMFGTALADVDSGTDATSGTGAGPVTVESVRRSLGEAFGGEVDVSPPEPPTVILNLARIRSVPFVVAGLLAALVVLGLGHQLLTSSRHRRRDQAVIRALGADRGWSASVVHGQVTATVLALVVVSVPLGLVAGRVVFRAFVDRVGAAPVGGAPLLVLLAGVGALLVLANVVALVPAARARRPIVAADLREE